jgi:Cytochrome P450
LHQSYPIDWIGIIKILIPLYIVKFYYSYYTRKSPLPGPFPLPLIGNFHQVGLNPAQYAIEHKEFGDMFEIWIGNSRSIVLSNPSLIDQIYISTTKNNKFFSRIPIAYFNGKGLIFNNDIPSWKRSRKFVVKSLTAPRFLKDFTHLTQSLFNENESFWDKNEYEIDFAISDIDKMFHSRYYLTNCHSYYLNTYLFVEENSDPIKSEEIKRTVKFNEAVKIFFSNLAFQVFTPEILKKYVPGFYHLNKK